MIPSADRNKKREDLESTFFMTNIVPQTPDNNQGYWLRLEEYSRNLVEQGYELYIISGGYGESGLIEKGSISIPSHLYKIIVVTNPGSGINGINKSTRVIAVDTPNINGNKYANWQDFKTTVRDLEAKTNYNFLSNVS